MSKYTYSITATITLTLTTVAFSQSILTWDIWRVEDGGNGHVYGIFDGADKSWSDSIGELNHINGHLAILTTETEASWVFNNVITQSKYGWESVFGPWIGAYREDGEWKWVRDEPWSWSPWADGTYEPPNQCSNYLMFRNQVCELGPVLCWDTLPTGQCSIPCVTNMPRTYIGEFEHDCNNNGIVDLAEILDVLCSDYNHNFIPDDCECIGDMSGPDENGNVEVNATDIALFMQNWGGLVDPQFGDFNHDGGVDNQDLSILLAAWGPCPHCGVCDQ